MIYLIGGASLSGKSVLARKLAPILGLSALSTDHFVQAFKTISSLEFETDQSDDNRARKMAPFFKELIARTLHSKQGFVLEGVHLLPEMCSELSQKSDQVRTCLLGFPTSTPQAELSRIRAHPKYPGDWLAECDDEKAMYYLGNSITRSQRDAAEAKALGLAYFNITEGYETAQAQAIKHLTNTKH